MALISSGLLDAVERIASEAGQAILEVYARDFSVEVKDDSSPVTEADRAAHCVIMTGLKALPEPLPILSEEDVAAFTGADAQGRYWLVDPLDGTKEFIKRNDEFTVNIALIERGRPLLGVVTAPALGLKYLAAQGVGAFRVNEDGVREPIRVAGKPAAETVWRAMVSRSHPSPALTDWLGALGCHELQPLGSSLKFCKIAEGKADVYPRFGPTSLWDTGAAQAIVEQAGGRVETFDGTPLSYAVRSWATAEDLLNPHFVVWGSAHSHSGRGHSSRS